MTPSAATTGPKLIESAVAGLDAWLDTARGPGGYGGPVAHWWQQSLLYTGPGLDWRYEGIVLGYLSLWERTGERRWLAKAERAGDDLLAGQLPSGHYAASAFEINPATAGTPHEAAADVALLSLALALRRTGGARWKPYLAAAERNLRECQVGALWDETAGAFRDSPASPSFVPNKAATAAEALFLLAEATGDEAWVERYALPTLDRVLEYQVSDGSDLDGAIAQNSFGSRRIEKYFPLYISRCVPPLLRGYRWTGDARYAERALRAMGFVARCVAADGSLPTVVYPDRRVSRYPSWVAPLGDVLRAADEVRPLGFSGDLAAVEARLLAGRDATGGIRTATGFAAQAGGRPSGLPDFRDVLHVAGWCDKAFRYLASKVSGPRAPGSSDRRELDCELRGRRLRLVETPEALEVSGAGGVGYRWRKGAPWAETESPEFWLR